MTNYNERLDEILERYRLFANMAYSEVEDGLRAADEFKDVALPKVLAETKQAILRWVADEVIGTKRDQEYRLIDTNWASTRREKVYLSDGLSRNKLRNEQRKILAQHGWKGDQR